jgi:hypothetical protein
MLEDEEKTRSSTRTLKQLDSWYFRSQRVNRGRQRRSLCFRGLKERSKRSSDASNDDGQYTQGFRLFGLNIQTSLSI